jgi:hypothetical protein
LGRGVKLGDRGAGELLEIYFQYRAVTKDVSKPPGVK